MDLDDSDDHLIYIQDLKSDDVHLKMNTVYKLPEICQLLGKIVNNILGNEKTKNLIVPALME